MALVAGFHLLGADSLIVALAVSLAIQGLFLVYWVFKLGYRHRLTLTVEGIAPTRLVRSLGSTFAYTAATQVWAFAFDNAVSHLPQGVFAVFKYVQGNLFSRATSLLLSPISTVYFTGFSEAVREGYDSVSRVVKRALAGAIGLSMVVVAVVVVAARPALEGIWGWAKFGESDLDLAVKLTIALFACLVVVACGGVLRKLSMALGFVTGQYGGAFVVQVVCALIAGPLVTGFGNWGAVGVVVFNTLALALVPVIVLAIEAPTAVTATPFRALIPWSVAGGLAVGVGLCLRWAVGPVGAHFGRVVEVGWAVFLGGVTGSIALLAAWLLGIDEVKLLLYQGRRFMGLDSRSPSEVPLQGGGRQ